MANYASSFLSGAATGATAGAAAGGVGSIVGGVLGGIAGLFGASEEAESEAEKQKILEQVKSEYNLTQDEVNSLLEAYYSDPDSFLGTEADVQAYREAIANYNPDDYVADFEDFSYDKTVDDFVNPYYDQIISETGKSVEQTAAGAGVGRGTGAANAIAKAQAEKSDSLYQTALNQYNTDRAQSYSEWSGNITAMQNKLNALKAAADTSLTLKGNLAQNYTDAQQQKYSDLIAAKQNQAEGNLKLAEMGLSI